MLGLVLASVQSREVPTKRGTESKHFNPAWNHLASRSQFSVQEKPPCASIWPGCECACLGNPLIWASGAPNGGSKSPTAVAPSPFHPQLGHENQKCTHRRPCLITNHPHTCKMHGSRMAPQTMKDTNSTDQNAKPRVSSGAAGPSGLKEAKQMGPAQSIGRQYGLSHAPKHISNPRAV